MPDQTEPATTESRRSQALGSLEARLMEVLWASERQLSVQDVCDRLQPPSNYKTVMTVMNRLVVKELLSREMNGRAYDYKPRVSKQAFLRGAAEELVKDYVASHGEDAGAHLERATVRFRPAALPTVEVTVAEQSSNGHGPNHATPSPIRYLSVGSDGLWRGIAALLFTALVLQALLSMRRRRR